MVPKAALGNCQKWQEYEKLEALFNLPPGKGKNPPSLVKGWLSVGCSFPKRQKKDAGLLLWEVVTVGRQVQQIFVVIFFSPICQCIILWRKLTLWQCRVLHPNTSKRWRKKKETQTKTPIPLNICLHTESHFYLIFVSFFEGSKSLF